MTAPGAVLDRDGTQWSRQDDGSYRAVFYRAYPLDVLEDVVGPLSPLPSASV